MDIEYNGKTYHVWTDGKGGIDRIFVQTDRRYQRDGGELGAYVRRRIPAKGPTYHAVAALVLQAENR